MSKSVPVTFAYCAHDYFGPGAKIVEPSASADGASLGRVLVNINNIAANTGSWHSSRPTKAYQMASGTPVECDRFYVRRNVFSDNFDFSARVRGLNDSSPPDSGTVSITVTDVTNTKSKTFDVTIASGDEDWTYSSAQNFAVAYSGATAAEKIEIKVEISQNTYPGTVEYGGLDIYSSAPGSMLVAGDMSYLTSGEGVYDPLDDTHLGEDCPVSVNQLRKMSDNLLFIQRNQRFFVCNQQFVPPAEAIDMNGAYLVDDSSYWHSRKVLEIPYSSQRGTGYIYFELDWNNTSAATRSIFVSSKETKPVYHLTKEHNSNRKHEWDFYNYIDGSTVVEDLVGTDVLLGQGDAEVSSEVAVSDSAATDFWKLSQASDVDTGNDTFIRATGMDVGAWSVLITMPSSSTPAGTEEVFSIKDGSTYLLRIQVNSSRNIIVTYGGTHTSSWAMSNTNDVVCINHDGTSGASNMHMFLVNGANPTGIISTNSTTLPDYTANTVDNVFFLNANEYTKISHAAIWFEEHTIQELVAVYDAVSSSDRPMERTRDKESEQVMTESAGSSGTMTGYLKVRKGSLDLISIYTGKNGCSTNSDTAVGLGGGVSGMQINRFTAWEAPEQ